MAPMFIYALFCQVLIFIVYASPINPTPNTIRKPVVGTFDPATHVYRRANFRVNATNVPQSISNWIDDVNAVSSFLNVALGLPLGSTTKAAALNALSFAQDEPTNLKLLRSIPGLDANGVAAASTLDAVFGDVLTQLQIIAGTPYSVSLRERLTCGRNIVEISCCGV
ncbi:hypothetical protein CJF30_00008707 [Rutstroemia sp. NJR-2017a BBW]|nr:hypothetical protein CJF30_00008707 [Rutstroemia sp. NJR-2017a BBW]